jgi:hypothetical protein
MGVLSVTYVSGFVTKQLLRGVNCHVWWTLTWCDISHCLRITHGIEQCRTILHLFFREARRH